MNQKNIKIHPDYISGLVVTDGSFVCSVYKEAKSLYGIRFKPEFSITADMGSISVLYLIQEYFGCGFISIRKTGHCADFRVSNIKDLINIIIPHFHKYPIFCAKLHAFKLFELIVNALSNKSHRSKEERALLINYAFSMNVVTQRTKEYIDEIYSMLDIKNGYEIPLIANIENFINKPVSDQFIAGVLDGEGCFHVSFPSTGHFFTLVRIDTDVLNEPLLLEIKKRFADSGHIRTISDRLIAYEIRRLKDIIETIIPFMDNNVIHTEKANHYQIFKEVSLLITNNKPLNLSTKVKIVELAYNSIKGGKNRHTTKEEYINLLTHQNSSN